jgi:hypothetical protein
MKYGRPLILVAMDEINPEIHRGNGNCLTPLHVTIFSHVGE